MYSRIALYLLYEMHLTEILGVSPLYQLVPTQELAPLVSYSSIRSAGLEPADFLPNAPKSLADAVAAKLTLDPATHREAIGAFCSRFAAFSAPELEKTAFRRPVIAGSSDTDVVLQLPPLHQAIFDAEQRVQDADLCDADVDVDVSVIANDCLELVPTDPADIERHIAHYRSKIHQMLPKGAKRQRAQAPQFAYKKRLLDKLLLAASRADAVHALIEQIGFEDEPSSHTRSSNGKVVLTLKTLLALTNHLQHLAGTGSLGSVDSEYLQRVQRLCVTTISANDTASLQACSLVLLIINASKGDKLLCLDSYIGAVVAFLSDTITALLHDHASNIEYPRLFHCLDELASHIQLVHTDEHILTKIEYMCIEAVFAQSSIREIDEVRSTLILILVQIFKSYPDQRLFIVNEMLSNFRKLPALKTMARKFQLPLGTFVLFFSVFIIRLLQSFDVTSFRKEATAFLSMPKSNNPGSPTNLKREALLDGISGVSHEAQKVADHVACFFLENLPSSDGNYKALFQVFVEDLVVLMALPDWPGAIPIISAIMSHFARALTDGSAPNSLEPVLIESMGKLATEILKLKQLVAKTLSPDSKESHLKAVQAHHDQVLITLLSKSSAASASLRFQFYLLRTIAVFYSWQKATSRSGTPQFVYSSASPEPVEYSASDITMWEIIDHYLSIVSKGVFPHDIKLDADDESSCTKAYQSILMAEELDSLYEKFIGVLTSSLQSSKAKLSAKSIRVLSPMIEVDKLILLSPQINESVSKLLVEGSPLTRDAVVDLLGQYMFANPELLKKYYSSVGLRADDSSILVRKRVLKLMKEVYLQSDSVQIKSYASIKILRRLEDEDQNLVELAKGSLLQLWMSKQNHKEVSEIFTEVVGLSDSCSRLFGSFMNEHAHHGYHSTLKAVVDTTIDEIIDKLDTPDQKEVTGAFQLVAILTECDGSLVSQDQLISLQPYIINPDVSSDGVCYNALKIMRLVLTKISSLRKGYIIKTHEALLERLTKFDTRELHEAIPVLERLSHLLGDMLRLHRAVISCLKLLKPFHAGNDVVPAQRSRLSKLLNLLGCFGSYCKLESGRPLFEKAGVGLKSNETITSLIAKYLLVFCDPGYDSLVRLAAVRNIISVSTYHPKFFLSDAVLKVLDRELAGGTVEMKLCIVSGLTRFLEKEDEEATKKVGYETHSSKDSASGQFLNSTLSLNDGVCASVTQRFMPIVLQLCLNMSEDVAEIPVSFLKLVMKLGYANPKVCIATIIALEASPNKRIKRIATDLHTDIFAKHESLADRSYLEAFKLAATYIKRLNVRDLTREALYLRSLYRIINKTYLSKKKFILSLAKLFSVDLNLPSLARAVEQRDTIVFLALNFLVLNFTSIEEICLVLYHLDRAVTRDGLDLAEKVTLTVGSQSGQGMSVDNLQYLFVYSQTELALVYLRQLLAAAYGIGHKTMEAFRPSKADVELRQQPKLVNLIDYPLASLELDTKLSAPGAFGAVFTRMVLSAKDYTT